MSNKILKYFYEKPEKEKIWQSIRQWLNQFRFSISFVFSTYKKSLVPPERNIPWDKGNWVPTDEDLAVSREMYERSEDRYNRLEEKAHKIFGVATFFVPIVLALFIFVLEHSSCISILIIMLSSLLFYLVSLWCCTRAIRIKERQSPGLELLINPEKDSMESPQKSKIIACYMGCSQYNEVVNDHVANFVKSSELFMFMAVLFTIFSGGLGLSYRLSSPVKEKNQVEIISETVTKSLAPLQKISENLDIQQERNAEIKILKEQIKKSEDASKIIITHKKNKKH